MAESLPIVCKFCREPLVYREGHLYERASGDQHFLGGQCPVVKGLDIVTRKLTRPSRRVAPNEI
jgi:hypothetical protein